MGDIVKVLLSGLMLLGATYGVGYPIVMASRPISRDVRCVRASLRGAPRTGRFEDFQAGPLNEDMMQEIGASEGFEYTVTGRKRPYFEYVGPPTEDLPDA